MASRRSRSVLTAVSSSLAVPSFASTTSSVCTVAGTTVTIVSGGACSIIAIQAGNSTYAAAMTVMQSFTVNKASQTITFGVLSNATLGVSPFGVSATASSGLAVTFSSTTSAVCTVSGSTVKIVAVGTCSIKASQAGKRQLLGCHCGNAELPQSWRRRRLRSTQYRIRSLGFRRFRSPHRPVQPYRSV